jgi:N-acetylmuramoyl-L-alanine amidase
MRLDALRWIQRLVLLFALALVAAGGWFVYNSAQAGDAPALLQAIVGPPRPLRGLHIGIVAGHHGNDSGAVCPDGLTEAEVNLAAAEAVVSALQQNGARVDLLEEFDDRLEGYRADAFVSIHADSCEVSLSGFKVASLEGGSEASQRLADCLWQHYEAATELPRHLNTITYDMTRYHAFREISPSTPAAIIEIGFLRSDRDLIAGKPDTVARGIADGIECFLKPTPQDEEKTTK